MIILIRPGQSTNNQLGLLVGTSDTSLTELGQRQSQALGPWLTEVEELCLPSRSPARPHCSRCRSYVRAGKILIEVDYGDLDGTSVTEITTEHWRAFEFEHERAFGGGESLADVDKRVHAELDGLVDDDSSLLHSPTRHLAIVSHVSPIKSAVTWALGVPGSTTWRMRLENGSMTVIGVRARGHQPSVFNVAPTKRSATATAAKLRPTPTRVAA